MTELVINVVGTPDRCKRGHLFDTSNTYVTPDGRRQCRECKLARKRKPLTAWQAANTPTCLPAYIRRNIAPGAGGCWLWTRSRSRDGYGWGSYENRTVQAHRLVYSLVVGPVPEGLELDHLCRVKHCVRPKHLEPVTTAENLRRARQAAAS